MTIKTKFDVGDIVMLKNHKNPCFIEKITITYSNVASKKVLYGVSDISKKDNNPFVGDANNVYECEISEKLNKKAFEKEYAKMMARQVVEEVNQNGK